ncbi:DUF1841 family protein [Povalibacter sp.]|uniref:DUF1841 family protein n=1 Tax=Povalibacter sp. TaxID=1962978 RepID=UPI002F3E4B6F
MPFFDTQSRDQLRASYIEAWRKRRERLPMQPLEMQIADVIELHPEYQQALQDPDSVLDRDYSPEGGQSNPFLHMGLHLAIRDQLATDRPPGIRSAFDNLVRRMGDAHAAEHELIECLAETLWESQRSGLPPDEHAYLARVTRQR